MKPEWRRFAPIGLYVALLALIVSGALYIVLKTFSLPIQISLGIFVIGLAAFIVLDPNRIRQFFGGRQARYGSNALVLVLAVIGIVVVVNYLVYKNPKRWDLTEDKENTLAPETLNTLSTLSETIKADAYYSSQTPSDRAQKLLESYKYNSKGKFDYEFIDPVKDVGAAQADKITRDGTIVLKMAGRSERVTYASEQDISAAIIRLANPGDRSVYFIQGHGEYDPNGYGDDSFSSLRTTLESKNYKVGVVNLLTDPKIPDNALALILAGPKKPLMENEVKLIEDYLNKGGSLVVLSGSPFLNPSTDINDFLVNYLAGTWGIVLGNDLVIDPSVNPATVTIVNQYGSHPITQKISQTLAAVLPFARSVNSTSVSADITLTTLASTAAGAWGETDLQSINNNQVTADSGKDVIGPVSLAVAAENSTTKARVVVIGSAIFATDSQITTLGNNDFIANSIDWAAEQENLISLTPKQTTSRILVPPKTYIQGLILLITVFIMPGMVIVGGIVMWIQRRRRG
jgi:ABC-type uncharacterized transport system involved in gliding motility auxiliary subunit